MFGYFLRRSLGIIPTLFVIITISFFLIRLAPGGPFSKERKVPKEIEEALMRAYHLDEPLWQQFIRYLKGLLVGDFGPSFKYKDSTVAELLWQGFPTSLQLGSMAILLAIVIGMSLGISAALRQNTATDYSAMGFSMLGIAIPNFVIAPIMTWGFGVKLNWTPVGGWGHLSNYILPVAALCLPQIAIIARLTRASMLEVLSSNYIRTARAKGLSERVTILRHALRAGLAPVISYLGPAIAAIVTGSVIIEQIFSIPGIGRYFVQSALNRDYTMVMGATVIFGTLILICNLAADIVLGLLDPKIRYD